MRKAPILAVLALAVLAGCDAQGGSALAVAGPNGVTGSPVKRPWSAEFATAARAFLTSQPSFHSHWPHHKVAVLMSSEMSSDGWWHGVVMDTDGALVALATDTKDTSAAIGQMSSPGDYIEYATGNTADLDVFYGHDFRVVEPGAVKP